MKLIEYKIETEANELNNESLGLCQFHSYNEMICKVYGHKIYYIKQYMDNKVTHILPLFYVSFLYLRRKLISIPYDGSFGGVISLNGQEPSKELYNYAILLGRQLKAEYIEIRSKGTDRILESMGMVKNINLIISEIYSEKVINHPKFIRKRKKDSKLAKNHNAIIEISNQYKDLKSFYKIMSTTMRGYGTPIYPFKYFSSLWKNYHASGHCVLLKGIKDGKMVSGLIILITKNIGIVKYSATYPKYIKNRYYNAMFWKAIDICLEKGCKIISFGTSFIEDTGLIKFKEGYMADSIPLISYIYEIKGKSRPLNKYIEDYKFLIKAWKRQPLITTQILGSIFWRWYC